MKQDDFLELFYSPYLLEDYNYDPDLPKIHEKETAKKLFMMIGKRRTENARLMEMLENSFTSQEKTQSLKKAIKSNTRIIWHLKKQISKLLSAANLTYEELHNYVFEESIKAVNFNIAEFYVIRIIDWK